MGQQQNLHLPAPLRSNGNPGALTYPFTPMTSVKPSEHAPDSLAKPASGEAQEAAVGQDSTDTQLIAKAQEGDSGALTTLLSRYQNQIYRFGVKMCGDQEDAKEVLQETLLAMARSLRSFRKESSVSTWLFTIARRFCIKNRRKSKFAPKHEQSLATVDNDPSRDTVTVTDPGACLDEQVSGMQTRDLIQRAIRQLDPEQREVFVLRDIEGLSAKEVAKVTELSVSAVKSKLHRARIRLRSLLAPHLQDELASFSPAAATATGKPKGDCPDILSTYSRFLEDEVTPDLCSQMQAHVEGCTECKATCDSLKHTLHVCKAAASQQPNEHLPEDVQIAVRRALEDYLSENA